MILSIIAGWFVGQKVDPFVTPPFQSRKQWLIVGVSFHVIILFIFKYLTFTASQLGILLHKDFSFIHIALPIGISFFTFQLLSYLFDIYYGKAHAQKSVLNVGLYIALFPQLIAGPIVRYDTIQDQIDHREENLSDFSSGMMRFIYGLAKKVLIANYVAQIADNIFDAGVPHSLTTAWLGAIAYTLQIYFDFSGYSDMAIGLGRMFGFHFPENFNYPYISRSATEFWRRWHMSLGTWFRDYVYIPLGGNKVSKQRWIFNLFMVWALTGIWHGANWTFLSWGLLYFILLLVEKLTGFTKKIGPFSHIYALVVIILGWTIFRSVDLTHAYHYILMMFGIGAKSLYDESTRYYLKNGITIWIMAILLSTPIIPYIQEKYKNTAITNIGEPLLAACLFLLSIVVTTSTTYNPFIYFNF